MVQGEKVKAGVPSSWNELPEKEEAYDRLDMARWLDQQLPMVVVQTFRQAEDTHRGRNEHCDDGSPSYLHGVFEPPGVCGSSGAG